MVAQAGHDPEAQWLVDEIGGELTALRTAQRKLVLAWGRDGYPDDERVGDIRQMETDASMIAAIAGATQAAITRIAETRPLATPPEPPPAPVAPNDDEVIAEAKRRLGIA